MTAPTAPKGLAPRGRALWRACTAGRSWDAAGLALLAEACRTADRLEKLDELLRGDVASWAELVDNYERRGGMATELQIDAGLSEARMLQTALLGTFKMLGLGKAEVAKAGPSVADQIKAKRDERVAAAKAKAARGPA